jgi:CDP-6-deoxy-D-xylo-4-hexulose-3-dehydrase
MIKLMKSTFFHEEETKRQLCDFIMKTEVLSMGAQCAAYEKAFAEKQGRQYALFCSSGSMANLLLLQAMQNVGRLRRGDKIAFSALTWATNVMPIIQLGMVPVAMDCREETLNAGLEEVKAAVAAGAKCVFITNALGFADDLPGITAYCQEQGVIFMEDNCESLGSAIGGRLFGNFGLASTFSTFVGHHLSTIEGGMVCTDDKELHESLLMVRAHGWDRNLTAERQKELRSQNGIDAFYARYTFYDLAYNGRPNEINGFLGLTQLRYWDEIIDERAANFKRFAEVMAANDDFVPLTVSHLSKCSNFAVPVVCRTTELAEAYRRKFEAAGVEIRPVIAGNITRQPFYRKYAEPVSCPHADRIHTNGFYFPNNQELTEDEIGTILGLLKK